MLGGKSHAKTGPTIQGLMMQAAVYGKTVPVIFGCTKVPYFVTWMANLRKHHSGKKGKKGEKKGAPPAYAANVDLLLGQNPLAGVLQVWNNKSKYPLDFKISEQAWDPFVTTYSTGDANFYAVVAVTLVAPLGVDFDHTSGDSVSYDDYGGGPVTYTGSREIPLWNDAYQGPDPTNPHVARYYPYSYYWKPGSGDSIEFFQNGLPGVLNATTLRIYYAAKSGKIPLAKLNCGFEFQLGEGSEYADADLSSQQIIYPLYAGVSSSEFDLGMAQMMPNDRFEVVGSYPLYPNFGWDGVSPKPGGGDADFADMFETIIRMGQTQAGFSADDPFSRIHLGLGCSEYPGTIQKKYMGGLEGFQCRALTYDLPNQPGNVLIATASSGAVNPAISDTDGNSYTTLFSGETAVVAYAQSVGGGALNTVSNGISGSPSGNDWDLALYEVGGVDTVLGTAVESGVSGFLEPRKQHTVSITVTSEPGRAVYLFGFARVSPGSGFDPSPVDQWKDLVPCQFSSQSQGMAGGGLAWCLSRYRIVYQPGTYSFTIGLGGFSAPWKLALVAMQGSQPPNYARPLGEIIEQETMNMTRRQCRVFGLRGSMVMDSHRKAADALEELAVAMNAEPVWSGFKLKLVPRSEVSYAGDVTGDSFTAQGWVTRDGYVSPTASGPVADLGEDDFIGDATTPLVTFERAMQADRKNILQYEHLTRESDYNKVTTPQPEMGPITILGPRREAPKVMPMFMQEKVARMILGIEARRRNYLTNVYRFKLQGKWKLLEPTDLVTITDDKLGLDKLPVRLTSVRESETYEVECEAEPFVYGLHSPDQEIVAQALAPFNPDLEHVPDSVNDPVIFEPPPVMSGQNNENELWFVVSDSDSLYGGCAVMISTDGGASYSELGVISGNGVTGENTSDWPGHANPDSVNDLALDLSESLGKLASYSVTDEDNFIFPCYVASPTATSVQFKHVASGVAAFTSANVAGNSIVVLAASEAENDTLTCTDSQGNTYALIETISHVVFGFGMTARAFLAYNVAAGANTVTVVSGASATLETIAIEYKGMLAVASSFDVSSPPGDTPGWTELTPYALGDQIIDSNGKVEICTVAGTSASSASYGGPGHPTWPTTQGNDVVDGSVRWNMQATFSGASHGIPGGGFTLSTGTVKTTVPADILLSWACGQGSGLSSLGTNWNTVFNSGSFGVFDKPATAIAEYSNTLKVTGGVNNFLVGILALKSAAPYGIPYELMTYAVAQLDSLYHYTLKATGGSNKLRRAVFGAPTLGQGIDHPAGSRFAFLDPAGTGILQQTMDPKWIGQKLYFKFLAFNVYESGLQDEADAAVYTYIPTGTVGSVNPFGIPSQTFLVNGG